MLRLSAARFAEGQDRTIGLPRRLLLPQAVVFLANAALEILALAGEKRGHDVDAARCVQHVNSSFRVTRRDLDRRVQLRCRCPSDEERSVEMAPLHF